MTNHREGDSIGEGEKSNKEEKLHVEFYNFMVTFISDRENEPDRGK